jgi:tRNA-dihydrouridine synthase B
MTPLASEEIRQVMTGHLQALHQHYGEVMGVRIARKHLGWYILNVASPAGESFRQQFNQLTCPSSQLDAVNRFFEQQNISQERAA